MPFKKKKKKTFNKDFFNKSISDKLWHDNNLLNIPITEDLDNTWFNSNISITNNPKDLLIDNHDINIDKPSFIIRSRKIKLFPTPKQKHILIKWLELYKSVYNITIRYLKKNPLFNINFIKLRAIIRENMETLSNKIKKYNIPSHTIDNAIHDVIKAIKVC